MVENLEAGGSYVKNARLVYYLYLASLVVGVTSIIGVIMAYLNRKEAVKWIQTHYTFQIRTFWISFVAGIVSGLLTFIYIGYFLIIAVFIWFTVRSVKGLVILEKGEPYPNPETWLW